MFPEYPGQRWGTLGGCQGPLPPASDSADNATPASVPELSVGRKLLFSGRVTAFPCHSSSKPSGACRVTARGVFPFSFPNRLALINIYAAPPVCPDHREYPEDTIP